MVPSVVILPIHQHRKHVERLQYHAALGRLYKSRCSLTFEDTLTLPYAVSSKHPPHQTPRTSTLTFTGGSTHTHSRTYADMAHTMRYAGMPGYSALGRQERGEASEEGRSGSGSGNVRYKLVAVMVHQGGDLGGHFYTYRRLPVQRPIRMATSGCTDTHSSSQFTFELSENTNMRTAEHTVQPTAPPAAPDVVSHTSAYTLGHGTPHTPQTTTQRTPTHTTHHKTAAHPAPHTPQSTTQRTPTHNTHHTTAAHPAPQATTAPGLTCTSGACEEPGTSGDACASKQRHTTRSKKEPSSVGQARGSADSTTHTDTNIHTGTQAPSAKALNAFADGEDTDHSTREDDVGDEWYLVSDETVRRVEFSTVQADSAYMLLYERI
ncbi:hypothetical protein SARC_09564 [Sphaeroforma arctica JP610]|uniref:USP domain-containing protein n=1 Tax=Sphaeroforma arctica JP610 TaxID=667725 RepID=A0A0L0FMK9_9EUKA|nr:hypothetical protein SARC_09564 [Sphaeroforma arctica JP610]KNC77990.1 hypothetical protein SARC_09564 [Sphaeroforma arctica JP610]|eukprot:XP_014151892.1 hypothetical protein SARC_09564 [Sphaeroforma arctica JP610]